MFETARLIQNEDWMRECACLRFVKEVRMTKAKDALRAVAKTIVRAVFDAGASIQSVGRRRMRKLLRLSVEVTRCSKRRLMNARVRAVDA